MSPGSLPVLALALGAGTLFAQSDVVFRSDVALVRVDAQVVDRDNRAITGMRAEDFVLRDEGVPRQIRHFGREDVPVDVLLLLDVSGSMQAHVGRVARASHQALRVLGPDDRVAVMVFDRATRLRMPFRGNREDVSRELERVLDDESFGGGTDITRALLDASAYVAREARPGARRAIVILTDDQTERGRDENGVSRSLARSDAVLSALLAPDAMRTGSWGGGWPTGGSNGGIIIGRRRGGLGRRMPGPLSRSTESAGTAEIARRSGGDSLRVDEASALETTLARIRQRYALYFHLPEGARAGQERNLDVELSEEARRRYGNAEVRFRRVYLTPGGPADPQPAVVARETVAAPQEGGWRRVDEPAAQPAPATEAPPAPPAQDPPRTGGWRRVGPGEQH